MRLILGMFALYLFLKPNVVLAEVIEWEFKGYGDLHFSHMNYGPNQNREKGSQKDSRFEFDVHRFVAEMEGELSDGWEFEVEVEIEHGGSGSTVELEYEEFGEFENEIEKGGEIVLEEINLQKRFASGLTAKLGRFPLAIGYTSYHSRPDQYLATKRPESEQHLIPAVWHEMGVSLGYETHLLELTLQFVNGLDSTGFSSSYWVSKGHQKRFETVKANNLATVVRFDLSPTSALTTGVSVYYGDTSANRPKPDLVKDCENNNDEKVASCGYISAPLTISDLHFDYHSENVYFSGFLMLGKLKNSDKISARNARLSNNLGVLRTPVAEQAMATMAEFGWDVAGGLGLDFRKLIPFFRHEFYDSMHKTHANIFDNPRFSKHVYTLGASYLVSHFAYMKLDHSQRILGAGEPFRRENTTQLSTGFFF